MWMHVHGIKTRKWKINPNLAYGKQTIKSNSETRTQIHEKGENIGILCERSKEKRAKNLNWGF